MVSRGNSVEAKQIKQLKQNRMYIRIGKLTIATEDGVGPVNSRVLRTCCDIIIVTGCFCLN